MSVEGFTPRVYKYTSICQPEVLKTSLFSWKYMICNFNFGIRIRFLFMFLISRTTQSTSPTSQPKRNVNESEANGSKCLRISYPLNGNPEFH